MKNLLKYIWIVGIITVVFSCTKDNDPAFSTTQAERIDAVSNKYINTLTKGDGKWISIYEGKIIEMVFAKDGTVSFKSDLNGGDDDRTVTYRVGVSQLPELVFQSHTVFHTLYDADVTGSKEYQFLFRDVTDKKITFDSKTDVRDKTKVYFYKMSLEGLTKKNSDFKELMKNLKSFKKLTKEGSKYMASVMINANNSMEIIESEKGAIDSDYSLDYSSDKTTLILKTPIDVDGVEVSEFVFDVVKKVFVAKNDSTIVISESDKPAVKLSPIDIIETNENSWRIVESNLDQLSNAKSSYGFRDFLDKWRGDVSDAGLTVENIYFRNMLFADNTFLQIFLRHPDGKLTQHFVDFSYTITDSPDGQIMKFIEKAPLTSGPLPKGFDIAKVKPLIDLLFNSGDYLVHFPGGLQSRGDTQGTIQLTSVKDPKITIHFYSF